MKVIMIRHGQTEGNLHHAYIGCRTDEPLCAQGVAALTGKHCPAAEKVYASPMKRCVETAQLLYQQTETEIVDDFRECDFGAFEGLNYHQLNGRADYQAWIDSGGEAAFPGGESRAEFAARCARAYEKIMAGQTDGDCAIVAHGGTIMAIMERYARPAGSYFDFQVRNGEGYILHEDGSYEPLRLETM